MKQVYRDLCTYSADLFGICSALYELGGLVVMHDASGCNSTYNTHDEPRWWSMDSMVYVSGLVEQDAILGNDERLINDCVEVAMREHPHFIALSRSVLPTYMGTDVRGIAHVIEKRTGIPTFGFATNGMDSYVRGAAAAFRALAERFLSPGKAQAREQVERRRKALRGAGKIRLLAEAAQHMPAVNLLGVTPLDFSVCGNVEALREAIDAMGFSLVSCWAMGDHFDTLQKASLADVNLVVSAAGLACAAWMQERLGIPYVIGLPMGRCAWERLRTLLLEAAYTGQSRHLFEGPAPGNAARTAQADASQMARCGAVHHGKSVLIIGEPVHAASVRYLLEEGYGCEAQVHVLCPLENDAGILRPEDLRTGSEEAVRNAMAAADAVIADPVYRRGWHGRGLFIDDPHEAYSGRMYHDRGFVYLGRDAAPYKEMQGF